MGRVVADMSISLDGYVAGPNDSRENPLGDDGERLHEWVFGLAAWRERQGLDGGEENRDSEIVAESFENVGAVVMGRRMFDNGEGPWGNEPFEGYWGEDPPYRVPVFVLTHHARDPLEKEGGTSFTFVTDGVESALAQAQDAAGDGDVSVAGGANVVRQFVATGLLDELELHLAPVLLGEGIRLFDSFDPEGIDITQTRVVESADVTHLKYRFGDEP